MKLNFLFRHQLCVYLLLAFGGFNYMSVAFADETIAYEVEILRDPSNSLTVSEVISSVDWTTPETQDRRTTNVGFTADTFWVKVAITSAFDRAHVIVIDYALLDDVILFGGRQAHQREIARAGDIYPIETRSLHHRLPAFEISPENATTSYYLRIRTGGSMQFPIRVLPLDAFVARTLRQNLLFGAYYGFMILLAIVAAVTVVQLREKVFAYYLAYITSLVLSMFSMNGFASLFLWPRGGVWPSIAVGLFFGFTCLFGTLFATDFLRARTLPPHVMWALRLVIAWAVITVLLNVFGFYPAGSIAAVCGAMLLVPIVLYATVIAYFRKAPGARYFLAAWGVYLGGAFIMALVFLGVAPTNILTSNIMQITSMVDAIVLSMALIERARILRREKASAVERANQYLVSMNEKLESEVIARTQELTETNEQLRNQAIRDSLTGLLNHKAVMERLQEELSATVRFNHAVAVVMMDVDYFKSINDAHGHQVGDKVLEEIALTLSAHLRQYDVCGRYGGDEFIIILNRTSHEDAMHFAERLRADVAGLNIPSIPEFKITASFGISIHTGNVDSMSAKRLVTSADRALYEAKAGGRDIVRYTAADRPVPAII